MKPTKENTLCLIIKQENFDEILNGSMKQEFREIKDTTYQKHLDTWKNGGDTILYINKEKISEEAIKKHPNNPMIYNNGIYPYIPIPYKFIDLAVGYEKNRDAMIIAVEDINFEPMITKEGKEARFSDEQERMKIDPNGELCIWNIVYTLGRIIKTDLKKGKSK